MATGIRADFVTWQFTAPPYDITHFENDVTGPITLMFLAFRETGHVPDAGVTSILLAVGFVVLFGCRRIALVRTRATPHRRQGIR